MMSGNSTRAVHVLFVCLGNICRSPLAEGVFQSMVSGAGLDDVIQVDSAGTGDWHVGEPPHPRTTDVALRRGVQLDSRARQVVVDDLSRFDYVIAMDASNRDVLRGMGGEASLHLLRDFDPEADGDLDVPDPYYGGEEGFELVHDIVERSCAVLLDHVREQHRL